jgi:hypothetical protein
VATLERTGDTERARRDELEQLQVELREAREALALVKGSEPPELATLRAAVAAARAQRLDVAARKNALEAELQPLETEARQLREVMAQRDALDRGRWLWGTTWGVSRPEGTRLLIWLLAALCTGGFVLYFISTVLH